jgi:hypothetical protein|tara:strand:- start:260 stop:427 length:168 start_codon:yes stop_codon:yes gene_type:complete
MENRFNAFLARFMPLVEALEAKQKEAETVSALKTSAATTGTLATAGLGLGLGFRV